MCNVNIEIMSLYQIPLLQWSYVYCNKLSSKFSPEPTDFFFFFFLQLRPSCQILNVTEFIWPEREEVEKRNWGSKVIYFKNNSCLSYK